MASMETTLHICLAILLVVSASAGGDGSLCSDADDPALCNKLTGGAKSWEEAMENAINGVSARVNSGKSVVEAMASKFPPNLKPVTKESIISTCYDTLDNISDNLQQCLEYVKDDPDSSLKFHLSAIMFSDCTDAMKEFRLSVPAEATQYNQEIQSLVSTLLALSDAKN